MEAPVASQWGPAFWIFLHSAAEQFGSVRTRLINEETRIWAGLLYSLRYSLPCPACKKHYTEYYTKKPMKAITRDTLRTWLWELHSDVNRRQERANGCTLEQLPVIYGTPFSFDEQYNCIIGHMKRALRLGWCSREDLQRTARFMEEMRRYYSWP